MESKLFVYANVLAEQVLAVVAIPIVVVIVGILEPWLPPETGLTFARKLLISTLVITTASVIGYMAGWLLLVLYLRWFVGLWFLIIMLEVIADEMFAYFHSSDPPTATGIMVGEWERVAAMRSANNGYGFKQFYPAINCDPPVPNDDPFSPHVSIVHVVEVRRHTMWWSGLSIWQVSMLDGQKKSLALELPLVDFFDLPFRRHIENALVGCYHSHGVFLMMMQVDTKLHIAIYDPQYDQSGIPSFRWHRWLSRGLIVNMTLLQRLVETDGTVARLRRLCGARENPSTAGWRIRILNAHCRRWNGRFQSVLTYTIIELRPGLFDQPFSIVSRRSIEFAVFDNPPWLKAVRTSDGLFGVQASGNFNDDGPCLLYDESQGVFVYCPYLEDLRRLDPPFDAYVQRVDQLHAGNLCPVVLNSKECIEAFKTGRIYRTPLAAPSPDYATAKSLFQARPNLRYEMTADQFRERTGIAGMDAHFG